MNRIHDYFTVEKLRDNLAKARQYKDLSLTYKGDFNLPNNNTRKFWDKRITGKYDNLPLSPIYRDKLRTITGLLAGGKGKVLDVGIGYGHLEKKLVVLNGKLMLFGVDISPLAIKRLKKLNIGDFNVASIFKLPYRDSTFDHVLVLDVLEHLPPGKVFLGYKELYRVLKKGGILIASIPLNEGLEKKILRGKNPGAHLREYTPDIIRAEFRISKFKILKEFYLYAFQKYYNLKKFIVSIFPFKVRKPNQMIIYAQKR